MKVNQSPAQADFQPICEQCEQPRQTSSARRRLAGR